MKRIELNYPTKPHCVSSIKIHIQLFQLFNMFVLLLQVI